MSPCSTLEIVMANESGFDIGTVGHAESVMMGDLIRASTRALRRLAVPWSKMSEAEQTAFNRDLAADCRFAVQRAVQVIAANARVVFRAEVDSVAFKGPDDVKAVLKLVGGSEAHALADTAGGFVTVVIEDIDALLDYPEDAIVGEPDQRRLGV